MQLGKATRFGGRSWVPSSAPEFIPTLWVDAATGDDSRSKATVAGSGGSLPWLTIGRAAWGSTDRSAPNTSEAAAAGDVVAIAEGTYSTNVSIGNRQQVVYNPANEGTSGNPIVFLATGVVVLGSPAANAPVIGAFERDYIVWYANHRLGHQFSITCDGRGASDDTKAGASTVNTKADTGPVVIWSTTGSRVEGCVIDGGPQLDYTDNWPAFYFVGAESCTVKNNVAHGFHNLADTINGTCCTLYLSHNNVIEHNYFYDCGTGAIFKDQDLAVDANSGNHIRLNLIEDMVHNGFEWSHAEEVSDRNFVYQNLVIGSAFGVHSTAAGLLNDWIYNNTFVNCTSAGIFPGGTNNVGGRYWNNIFENCSTMVYVEGGEIAAAAGVSLEHNVYHTFTTFYDGSGGTMTFAAFNAAHTDQHAASPTAITSDPLFVDSGAGNYRLQAGSPARDLARHPGTGATMHAGCYQTGNEQIGLES